MQIYKQQFHHKHDTQNLHMWRLSTKSLERIFFLKDCTGDVSLCMKIFPALSGKWGDFLWLLLWRRCFSGLSYCSAACNFLSPPLLLWQLGSLLYPLSRRSWTFFTTENCLWSWEASRILSSPGEPAA